MILSLSQSLSRCDCIPRGVITLPLFIEGVPKGGGSIYTARDHCFVIASINNTAIDPNRSCFANVPRTAQTTAPLPEGSCHVVTEGREMLRLTYGSAIGSEGVINKEIRI